MIYDSFLKTCFYFKKQGCSIEYKNHGYVVSKDNFELFFIESDKTDGYYIGLMEFYDIFMKQ